MKQIKSKGPERVPIDIIKKIYDLNNMLINQEDIAKIVNLGESTVSLILNKKLHYSDLRINKELVKKTTGFRRRLRKLDIKLVIEIKELYVDGFSISEISNKTNVSTGSIGSIVNLKTYTDIDKKY